ncbi:sigma-70 family RNA polymerase sigma factor [Thalassobellus suaedae]|uniref:Sigma-70 family RNA polymerase sigma factor n=1 Tax=Thalassobellus suaedae TaxID=3074124 RepID=A0ABY9XZ15_9FLAO|nr:sigma-70 family RNA polymerase sigma factor [Flavobacteriaceae bacterium HL-DH10]
MYKDHFNFLCLVSFQITKDREAAKDIVQDFFIYLWKKEKKLEITVSFNSYATRAVKNLSLQHIEKLKRIDLNKSKLSIPEYDELDLFDKSEEKKTFKIRELVNQIPESRRNIFISHVVDGLSYSQIAENYGISINTVKTQMKRSYAFLRSIENSDLTAVILLFLFYRN